MITQEKIKTNWTKIVRQYNKPTVWKSNTQLATSLVPYIFSWWVAYQAFQYSWLLCFLVAFFAQFLLLRIFIIMHDCGHSSFYKSKTWCNIVGFICGSLTFSPYLQWSRSHRTHHKYTGNLDQRGVGDVTTLTVEEYKKLSLFKKLCYQITRSPMFFLFLGPFFVFIIEYRFTKKEDSLSEKLSVHLTNFIIITFGTVISYFAGIKFFLIYQFSVISMAAAVGIFLFYVQHQYKEAYWESKENWNFVDASLKGSSYLKLPKILQWATGNIGFHHIHHLCSTIPNYNLEKAYKENGFFQKCVELNLKESVKSLFLSLYDTNKKELISFREYRKRYKQKKALTN